MMGYGSGMGGGLFFGLLMIIGLILLGVVLVRVMGGGLSRGGAEGSSPTSPGAPAKRVLDERYARGELSTEEYQERLRVLRQSE